jgi:hypothetical protein
MIPLSFWGDNVHQESVCGIQVISELYPEILFCVSNFLYNSRKSINYGVIGNEY